MVQNSPLKSVPASRPFSTGKTAFPTAVTVPCRIVVEVGGGVSFPLQVTPSNAFMQKNRPGLLVDDDVTLVVVELMTGGEAVVLGVNEIVGAELPVVKMLAGVNAEKADIKLEH